MDPEDRERIERLHEKIDLLGKEQVEKLGEIKDLVTAGAIKQESLKGRLFAHEMVATAIISVGVLVTAIVAIVK